MIDEMEERPYIENKRVVIDRLYNSKYGDQKKCECGHIYYRHFDTYDGMEDCGCKYCGCSTFKPLTP